MNPRTMKTILILLCLATSAFADPLGGITISKNKQNQTVATWKGSPKGKAGEARPLDEHVAALAQHPEVEVIEFDGQMGGPGGLTGSGFAALTGLPKLVEIRLNGINAANMNAPGGAVPFGSQGFTALARMKNLRTLSIQHANVAVGDIAMLLRTSTSLEELNTGTKFCDELLAAAAEAPKLKKFVFGHWDNVPKDAPLTLNGYGKLAQMKHLEILSTGIRHPKDVPWSQLTPILGSIPKLRELTLIAAEDEAKRKRGDPGPVPFTAADLAALTKATTLTDLGIWHATLAPGSLAGLKNCRSLKSLTLRGTRFDEADLATLKQAIPGLKVQIVGEPKQR